MKGLLPLLRRRIGLPGPAPRRPIAPLDPEEEANLQTLRNRRAKKKEQSDA